MTVNNAVNNSKVGVMKAEVLGYTKGPEAVSIMSGIKKLLDPKVNLLDWSGKTRRGQVALLSSSRYDCRES